MESVVTLLWLLAVLVVPYLVQQKTGVPDQVTRAGFVPSGVFFFIGIGAGANQLQGWTDMMALGLFLLLNCPMLYVTHYQLRRRKP